MTKFVITITLHPNINMIISRKELITVIIKAHKISIVLLIISITKSNSEVEYRYL